MTDYKLQHYNEQLLPCPFCGKKVYLIPCEDARSDINNRWWEIGSGSDHDCCRCNVSMVSDRFSCFAYSERLIQRDMLIKKWNRRAQ